MALMKRLTEDQCTSIAAHLKGSSDDLVEGILSWLNITTKDIEDFEICTGVGRCADCGCWEELDDAGRCPECQVDNE